MKHASQHRIAGTLEPGKSLALLFEILRDLQWHSFEDLRQAAPGVQIEQRLRKLKKLGNEPRRGQTHTWMLELDETGKRARFRSLTLK
ncbi:MAG: hypothetical protein K2X35_20185 [Bryobacteraceae bacterium]|nr:hypothetical protein [Bryobacteraceae bacterium]